MKMYTATQPLFFAPIYMMERFFRSDFVVVMEEAQYSKLGHQAKVDICTKTGRQSIILPLRNRDRRPLNEIEVDGPKRWSEKLVKTLKNVYGKKEGFMIHGEELCDQIIDWARTPYVTASMIGTWSMIYALEKCAINCTIHMSTDLVSPRPADANEWIVELGIAAGGTDYLGGGVALASYIDPHAFLHRGLTLHTQKYVMPPYAALSGLQSEADVSFLDPFLLGGRRLVRELISPQR